MRTKPTKPAARKRRVPNAERSAQTRGKLLNATVDCLFEVGYHQTSTVLVTKRADVSRGSMLHHFPSKADLIMAAADFIVASRRAVRDETLAALPAPRERLLALIDLAWSEYTDRTGVAWIEIMLGARSDHDLGPRFAARNAALDVSQKAFVRTLLAELNVHDDALINGFVELYLGAVRGLAIQTLVPHAATDVVAAVEQLKFAQLEMLDSMIAHRPLAAATAGVRG